MTLMTRGRDEDLDRAAETLRLALKGPVEITAPMNWADSTIMLAEIQLKRGSGPGIYEALISTLQRVVQVLGESAPVRPG
jgi:hypothetical protein